MAERYGIPVNSRVAHRLSYAEKKPPDFFLWAFYRACQNRITFGEVVDTLPEGARRCKRCFKEVKA